MSEQRDSIITRLSTPLTELFGLSRGLATSVVLGVFLLLSLATFWFFHSAPPRTIYITTGPAGSSFESNAVRYAQILLASNGVTLKILHSEGSLQNLDRLQNSKFKADIGFIQGGITNAAGDGGLVSLGSISYQPLLIFYRGTPVSLLSDFKGKRLAIGAPGSGTRSLSTLLLGMNGLGGTNSVFLDWDAKTAAAGLAEGTVEAIFLMGDSASPQIMRQLLLSQDVQLFDFKQADGYTRRISYLNKLILPQGSMDFGKNIPSRDITLIGPTVELLAKPVLHPALCDIILDAAKIVHGGAKLMQRKDEFPAPIEHDFPISVEAKRYFSSGKSFLYRSLPFWLAILLNRVLVAFVPLVILLIPTLRMIPALYKWRMRLLIYRRYRALLALERELRGSLTPLQRQQLVVRLGEIEDSVNKMKIPASFGDQFYGLRGHIGFVRQKLEPATDSV